jgi:predicted GTPase
MWKILSAHYRQLVPIVGAVAPFIALAVLGVFYLMEKGWFLWWGAGSMLIVLALTLYRWFVQKRLAQVASSASMDERAAQRSPLEAEAWDDVLRIADEVQEAPPKTVEELRDVGGRVIRAVSRRLHPGKEFAEAHFTLPDVLWAIERGLADLRGQVEQRVPAIDVVQVSDLLTLHQFYLRYGSWGKAAWYAYRVYRMVTNPLGGVIQEGRQWLQDKGADAAFAYFKGQVARSVVEELGRTAIDLYAGRLRADARALMTKARNEVPEPADPLPLTVLMAGQIGSGKSSLVNALLEDVRAGVSEVPVQAGIREYRLQTKGRPELLLIDTVGLDGSAMARGLLSERARDADLILWVVSAASPARQEDCEAMELLQRDFAQTPSKRPPPILIAATHIDRLRPQREWSPPYDVVKPSTLKAQSINGAIAAILQDLPASTGVVVPVALRPNEEPYNMNSIWALIGELVPQARQVGLRRILEARRSFDPVKVMKQATNGGLYLGKKALDVFRLSGRRT